MSEWQDEADRVLEAARVMFEKHSKDVTGHVWDFATAGEHVRTIWIIKAMRALESLAAAEDGGIAT